MRERMMRAAMIPAAFALSGATTAGLANDQCDDPVAALPENLRSRYTVTDRLLIADDAESAADYAELLLAEAPQSVAVLELAARVYQALEEDDQVADLVAAVRRLCPQRSPDLAASAPAGPLDEARTRYHDLLGARTERQRQQLLPRAISAYERFLDDDGAARIEARHALAVLYLFAERFESSRATYRWLDRQGALEAGEVPEYLRLLRSMVHTSHKPHYFDEGEGLLESWRDRLEPAARALAERHFGFIALHLERHDAARQAFAAAVERAPDDGEAHFGLAAACEHESRRLAASGDRTGSERMRRLALEYARQAIEHPRYGEAARALIGRLQFDG